jgi:hypothetical protein
MLSDTFKYVSTLENSKFFKDVTTKYTRTKKIQDRDVTEFEFDVESEIPVEKLKAQK